MIRLGVVFFLLLVVGVSQMNSQDVEGDSVDFDDMEDDVDIETEDEGEPAKPAGKVERERPHFVAPTKTTGNFYMKEYFASGSDLDSWTKSAAKKDDVNEEIAKYDGTWVVEEAEENAVVGDLQLILKDRAKHHALSKRLSRPFHFSDNHPFVMQYEVRFQNGLDCGGAYVKLLSDGSTLDLAQLHDKTPYTIMFGPDKCGMDSKLHFIFRHRNPKTGEYEEKHAKKPTKNLESYFSDQRTHLYTLVVKPDNQFEVYVDQQLVNSGSLLEDFTPPVNPPKEIDDPNDRKPSDWDDRKEIPDPSAKKPDDWDETEPEYMVDEDAVKPDDWLESEEKLIPDESAVRPDDWDDDMDGEWEPPKVDNPKCSTVSGCGPWSPPKVKNPKYKGAWSPPKITNPAYQGEWHPRRIENPNWFEDLKPFKMTPIGAVGLELWSMTDGIVFDNFLVTDSKSTADDFAGETWLIRHASEAAAAGGGGLWSTITEVTNERPWIWAVLLFVVVLPTIVLSRCWKRRLDQLVIVVVVVVVASKSC